MTEEEFFHFRSSNAGVCRSCRMVIEGEGIEPDGDEYECPLCDNATVCGMELALILDLCNLEVKWLST